jgi:hypothetical protein
VLEAAFPRYNREPDPLSTVLRKLNYLAGLLAVAACVQKRFYSLIKCRAGAAARTWGSCWASYADNNIVPPASHCARRTCWPTPHVFALIELNWAVGQTEEAVTR